ncbi:MAG: hemin-degrading factor [Rhizobiaceae bacterium]|nr:hemin-degrading factor [Rhizobiaceae bacterium]
MTKPLPGTIREARAANPKMRERDLAAQLGISEAEFVAAWCGDGTTRIDVRVEETLKGLTAVGEVMALTRNESAVHEKIGVYENISSGDGAILALGEQIDLRIFPRVWAHGFAVEKRDGDEVRRSLQFFDAAGEAVHKVHLRPASDVRAFEALVASLMAADQSQSVAVVPSSGAGSGAEGTAATAEELRDRWSRMTDVHQFFGLLRQLRLTRQQAMRMVGTDYAWMLDTASVPAMFDDAASRATPIMCFVGSQGCIQIHHGPIGKVSLMGPWINVMDETFHLHLRLDHVREAWAVRKPTKDGHVTSVELYDAAGRMIIQFFGERHEGETERADWREIAESMPRVSMPTAA